MRRPKETKGKTVLTLIALISLVCLQVYLVYQAYSASRVNYAPQENQSKPKET